VTESPDPIPGRPLTSEELLAVAALWKKTSREFVTSFAGTSMQPTIPAGAAVTVRCGGDVAVGDVITYVWKDRPIVHRIVAVARGRFLTRGDAEVLPDPVLLERDAIVGKVLRVCRDGAWIAPAFPSRSAVASMIAHLCALVSTIAGPRVGVRLIYSLRLVRGRLRAANI
jgi:signal peptidase I